MTAARALREAVRRAGVGRAWPAMSTAAGLAAIAAGTALLAVSGYLISRAAERPPILLLGSAIVAVRALSIGRAVSRYLERLASHDLALRALARLRAGFVARLLPLVPAGLPHVRAADLMSRFVGDVDRLQDLFLRALVPPAVAAAAIVLAGLAAAAMLPAAGVALVLVLAAAALAVPGLTWLTARTAGRRQAAARADLTTELVEVLQGAPEIVAWGRQDEAVGRVAHADRELTRLARRDALASGLATGLGSLAASLAVLAVLVAAVPAVRSGALAGVLLAALVLLAVGAFEAVAPLPAAAQGISACASAAARLEDLVDRPVPVRDPATPRAAPAGGSLALRGAVVRAAPDGPVLLDGVDLDVRRGRAVALVGASGSGKTTLCEALVRLRDLDGGDALLDGHPIGAYAQADVRRAVTLVPQEAHVFDTTIAANLRIARPDATDGEVEAALARAGLGAGWVRSRPGGLDAPVGESGSMLSGGERRRLAVARGLLSGCPLVVLDEPSAHLDAASERAMLDDLVAARDRDGVGLLVVTHRLVGLEAFDEVVVLDAGRVAERGSPRELAAADGPYARLAAAAAGGATSPGNGEDTRGVRYPPVVL